MRLKLWVALLVIVAALCVTWSEAHARRRRGAVSDSTPQSPDDSTWILTGILSPMVTAPIDARNVELAVPVNSWVVKGQVIGAADCECGPEQNAGRAPFVSPADGLLVTSDVVPGAFGIASDPDLLCVHTRVRPADITSLRLGQQGTIAIYSEPAATLHATVSAIADTPINFSDGAAYPVTLSVEDPAAKRFAGASVQVRLRTR